MPELLPLFPLQLVAVPGRLISLHIFEPRYKEMVGEAIMNQSEFGIVPASEDGISNIGCTVTVVEAGNYQPDGSFDIVARGRRRFKILSLNQEKPYLRGEVQYFEAPPPGPAVNGSGRKPVVH